MSFEQLRASINISNLVWWALYGGLRVKKGKWCKNMGWVSLDFDCDGCTQCESKNG